MKKVLLLPGFTASDLAIVPTGERIWWDPSIAAFTGLGALRLGPDGKTPLPPDGRTMALVLPAQNPWPDILSQLRAQLDISVWSIEVDSYDWRLDLIASGQAVADLVRRTSSAEQPATIVGHSAGGLVATAAWANLVGTGEQSLVRRLITICSPFQGSYGPIEWLTGISPTIRQLRAVETIVSPFDTAVSLKWTLAYLNEVALTWPSFYQLFPGLGGSEERADPNRALLYDPNNYPIGLNPLSKWLNYSREVWQPLLRSPAALPPDWVLTSVTASSLATSNELQSSRRPLHLNDLGATNDGDGVVTVASARRSGGQVIGTFGGHASVTLGITRTGLLAQLITDPRGPLSPPPPVEVIRPPIPMEVTDPPQSDDVSGLVCVGGG